MALVPEQSICIHHSQPQTRLEADVLMSIEHLDKERQFVVMQSSAICTGDLMLVKACEDYCAQQEGPASIFWCKQEGTSCTCMGFSRDTAYTVVPVAIAVMVARCAGICWHISRTLLPHAVFTGNPFT